MLGKGGGKARNGSPGKHGSKIKVYTVNNKTIYYANILSARKGCKGSVGGCRGGRLLAVEPISSHFSRLTYENLNLRMQNGSWTRQHKTTQREARDESAATPPTLTLPLSLPPRAELSACKCVCNGLNMLDRPLSNMHMHCVCVCGCV